LKALKKLEQTSKGGAPAPEFWLSKSDQKKTFGTGRTPLRRIPAVYLILLPALAVGGWLLRNYILPPAEKSRPVSAVPHSARIAPIDMPAAGVSAAKRTDLGPKSNTPQTPGVKDRKETTPSDKSAHISPAGVRDLKQKEEKLPAMTDKARPQAALRPPVQKRPSDFKSFQTTRTPGRAADSSSSDGDLVSDKLDKPDPPPVIPHPSRTIDKPAVNELPALTGFSVQAIAWSKNPAERIAVINGLVVREGGSVEGMLVIRIDLDEVYLKKGDQTWLLRFGQK